MMMATAENKFEELYIKLRNKEGRIYTDAEVAQLPKVPLSHVHFKEWQVRERSSSRLIDYLKNKNQSMSILEVGCGNGWLSGKLSTIKDTTVTGTDINHEELEQAKRVFKNNTNCNFKEGDIRSLSFENTFDVIVFAASIQYFSSFDEIIETAISLLNPEGEIHIIDSFFYSTDESKKAKERTEAYYRSMGCEDMWPFYFHHQINSLKKYSHHFLYDPMAIKNRIFGNKDPFPWVCIKA